MQDYQITDLDQLLALYGEVPTGAVTKERTSLHPMHQDLIAASPLCAFATVGPDGTDCTPRGDEPGFVRVVDEHTLELPDRKGNNRLDSLRNIVADGRCSLLFVIPHRIDTMRVNGRAIITTDPTTLASHAIDGKAPATVIRITVEAAYLQCGKAMIRSKLWDPSSCPAVDGLPTPGQLSAAFRDGVDVTEYDAGYEMSLRENLL